MCDPPPPYFDFGGYVVALKKYTIYEAHNPHRMLIREGDLSLVEDGMYDTIYIPVVARMTKSKNYMYMRQRKMVSIAANYHSPPSLKLDGS